MLIKCPECELQVSDKAYICPHCGYPLKPGKKLQANKSPKRLPNGFGQISMIKKNLRKPYRAMITVKWSPTGRPVSKIIGYYETYNDAYEALIKYHKNPYDVDKRITLKELYDQWSEEKFKKIGESRISFIKCTWKYCKNIENIKISDLKAMHIKSVFDGIDKDATKQRVKAILSAMLDYAIEWELINHNCAKNITVDSTEIQKDHIAFTNDEISKLWKHAGERNVDMILIQSYTGMRPNELCSVKNVNIYDDYLIAGSKTKAGINRYIPIHSAIKEIIIRYKNDGEYLFKIQYDAYRKAFARTLDELDLNPEHRPHDPRKTFITFAKKYKVDEYAIKYIVGHAITDLTEGTYTERDPKWLNSEIEKIKI